MNWQESVNEAWSYDIRYGFEVKTLPVTGEPCPIRSPRSMATRNLAALYVQLSEQREALAKIAYKGDGNPYAEGSYDCLRDILAALDKIDEPPEALVAIEAARKSWAFELARRNDRRTKDA